MQQKLSAQSAVSEPRVAVSWDDIDTVLLDMDGTLLDLNYDNHVWNQLVPEAFSRHRGIPIAQASSILLEHMQQIRGSIEFYRFEYWTEFTGIDLIAAHRLATELVAYRPGALEFLRWVRSTHRRCLIATNADFDSIRIKEEFADIGQEVDAVVSSHQFGAPKEHPRFWQALHAEHPFEPARTLFIDDNVPVLEAAALAGIGHLLAVSQPDSEVPARTDLPFEAFNHFAQICPALTDSDSVGP